MKHFSGFSSELIGAAVCTTISAVRTSFIQAPGELGAA